MMVIPPFALEVQELASLGADRAVEFFRRLLWAEAKRVGIGRNVILVPDCINVGDGGIDAYVDGATPATDEVIPNGTNGFQIKASDLLPASCKKELHEGNDLGRPIQPEIRRILDANGTYVLVLYAGITGQQKEIRARAVTEE